MGQGKWRKTHVATTQKEAEREERALNRQGYETKIIKRTHHRPYGITYTVLSTKPI
ncbi:MAG: hypothetical protein KAS32_19490 [Candidatus Peribacteraceae bacterium]|nr:hypothetical protein [Candidatus Peribacteraceae bacterium]